MCLVCQSSGISPARQSLLHAGFANQTTVGPTAVIQSPIASTIPQTTLNAIAGQLTTGYWASHHQSWGGFAVRPGEAISVNISGLTMVARATALLALDSWTQTTGIRFSIVNDNAAQITMDDTQSGAFATRSMSAHVIQSAQINVSDLWTTTYGGGVGSYGLQTFIHEIGHALGLGHAGNYNGAASAGQPATIAQDSWQSSVMSYYSQTQNHMTGASYAFVAGPMQADIQAISWLYGANASIQPGNSTYGVGSTAGAVQTQIGAMMADGTLPAPISFTIVDRGGFDSFNFSTDRQNQVINLTPGAASSIYGLAGNLLIERSSVIEQVRAGQGNDIILGNAAANWLFGNDGRDRINGAGGDDRIFGGSGNDLLFGGAGRNSLNGGDGRDRLTSSTGTDVLTGGFGADVFAFANPVPGQAVDRDVINDFVRGTDLIDLTALGRVDEVFRMTAGAMSILPHLCLTVTAGGTLIRGEMTGDTTPEFEIFVSNVVTLTAADFIL